MAYAFASASSQSITSSTSQSVNVPLTFACFYQTSNLSLQQAIFSLTVGPSGTYRGVYAVFRTNPYVGIVQNIGSAAEAVGPSGPSSGAWAHVCGVYSGAASRTSYLDGVAGTENTDTSGTSQSGVYLRIAEFWNNAYLDGKLCEFVMWSAALTAGEITSLSKGFSPRRIRPQSLVFYAPLVRNLQDVKAGLALTNNNSATVADHPRVY